MTTYTEGFFDTLHILLPGEGLDFPLLYQEIPEKTTGKDLTDML